MSDLSEKLQTISLRNLKGTEVQILNMGLTLRRFCVRLSDGSHRDLVLGMPDEAAYVSDAYLADNPCLGGFVGRYANRIKNASFELEGKTYPLAANNGAHCLHGGISGFHVQFWDMEVMEGGRALLASYHSPEGEEGFPGNVHCQVRIELSEDDALSIEITADTDQPTPLNLTWHPYFNLDPIAGRVDGHSLQLHADKFLVQDEDLVPTGVLASVRQTPLDFQTIKDLLEVIALGGVDSSFVVADWDGALRSVALLQSADEKISLHVLSDAPIVHVYTAQSLGRLPLFDGHSDAFSAICLECQQYTDAVHHPQFPSTIIAPGKPYKQRMVLKVIEA